MSTIDLHIHSHCSDDGQFTMEELIQKATQKHMQVISIADHNTTKVYLELPDKMDNQLTIIPGIELDCTIGDVNLHCLGYGIDPHFAAFEQNYETIIKQEVKAASKRIELVQQLGIVLDVNKIMSMAPDGVVTGELIAEVALDEAANNDNELLKPYRTGGSRSDNPYVNFYWDFCAKGKSCYVDVHFITLEEAVQMVHAAKGIAVLAHPGNNVHENEQLLDKIMAAGVAGIEVYSSYHSSKQIEFYHNYAKKHQLLITCGSDYHGKTKPSIEIGQCDPKESFEELYNSFQTRLAKI